MSERHRWERSAFTLHDAETNTTALVRRRGERWMWSVVDRYGVSHGEGETVNESGAKGQAAPVFDSTVKASRP